MNSSSSATTTHPDNAASSTALIVTLIISSTILLYCVFFGSALLNLFSTRSEYSVLSSPLMNSHDQVDSNTAGSQSRLTGIERVRSDGDYGSSADGNRNGGNGSNSSDGGSSGTKRENVFFHALMMLVACYGAMVLTSWSVSDGSTPAAAD